MTNNKTIKAIIRDYLETSDEVTLPCIYKGDNREKQEIKDTQSLMACFNKYLDEYGYSEQLENSPATILKLPLFYNIFRADYIR